MEQEKKFLPTTLILSHLVPPKTHPNPRQLIQHQHLPIRPTSTATAEQKSRQS